MNSVPETLFAPLAAAWDHYSFLAGCLILGLIMVRLIVGGAR